MKYLNFRNIIIGVIFFLGLAAYWLGAVIRDNRLSQIHPEISSGSPESCLDCHAEMKGFSPFHDPALIGCASCHLGNPNATKEKKAHEGMFLVPGNLSDVDQTCGTANCHAEIAGRVENSLMTTMSGVITVDRFVFGEIDTLNAHAHIAEIGHSPADQHLRHLCASCHLGNEKKEPAPISERSRGGGCLACHLNPPLSAEALAKVDGPIFPESWADDADIHPSLTLRVTNEHCFGCHSRSGRISLGYEGWHETLLTQKDIEGQKGYRILQDHRVVQMISPDVHHEAGMDCIDCHSGRETMGDGTRYYHEEDAVKVECGDCHFHGSPETASWAELEEEDQKILAIRQFSHQGHRFLKGPDSGEIFWNGWVDSTGRAFLLGKNSGEKRPLNPPASICTKGEAHDALTCSACHTAWAPQCVGCHSTYDPDIQAYDLLDKKRTPGKWVEYLGGFFADPPVLGVVEKSEIGQERLRQIKTFIPGMIMTTDVSGFPGKEGSAETFHRLYAPVAPHTTTGNGRTCESCHLDPLALGYGRGELTYSDENGVGKWFFTAEYANAPQDDLPQDAWIPFLEEPTGLLTTRPNARPFNLAEQKRILTVGACLTCHSGDSKVMKEGLEDFEKVLKQVSGECLLPQK